MASKTVGIKKFSVDEYYRLAEAGVLHEDDRIELIEGIIVEMAPIDSRHAACVERLNQALHQGLKAGQACVRIQDPLRLSDDSAPQPDVVFARYRDDFYASEHPRGADVLLVVEVADTSAHYDRDTKLPLYASAGIPEVWLVDLTRDRVEAHREPSPGGYRTIRLASGDDTISPASLPEMQLSLGRILS